MTKQMIKFLPRLGKLLLMISVMVISMAYFIASINQAAAATLNTNVTVTGDNVTLGDIFVDITNNADFVLAPAPMPDKTLTWDARTIKRIVNRFNLSYRVSMADQVQINRLATIIHKGDLQKAILKSLNGENINKDVELEFVGNNIEIILPHELQDDIQVLNSSYNPARNTFSATLKTADNKVRNYTGVIHNVVQIPVLKHSLRRGDLITRNKVKTITVREDHITDDMVLAMDELVGMTPRRVLPAGAPVAMKELDKPIMIERGDLVTMQLQNGPIAITAIAKAMESGAKGDVIRLMNMDSKRTLEAQVTNLREARIFN